MGGKASLLLVMGFSFILAYISFNLNRYAVTAVNNMSLFSETAASHNLAAAGVHVMLSKFYQDTTLRGTFSQTFDTTNGSQLTGSFTATITDVGFDKVMLRSVSTYPRGARGVLHDTIEVYFNRTRKNSFTLFAWMTNSEGNDNFWASGDTISGRVHTNGRLLTLGSPVFGGKVTASKGIGPKPVTGGNRSIFKQGFETGVASVAFPGSLAEFWDGSGGRLYSGTKWVTLHPGTSANNDGYILVRNTETGPLVDSIPITSMSFSQRVLASYGDVNVQGTLDGSVTIASNSNIRIQGNVRYEKDPFEILPTEPPSDDLLGLVAEDSVIVADRTATTGDVHIDGSIFARTGSFAVENLSTRPLNGQLTVHGSIVQYTSGTVATYADSNYTRTQGYARNYRFDERLKDPSFKPPHYPWYYSRTPAIISWWESFRVNKPED